MHMRQQVNEQSHIEFSCCVHWLTSAKIKAYAFQDVFCCVQPDTRSVSKQTMSALVMTARYERTFITSFQVPETTHMNRATLTTSTELRIRIYSCTHTKPITTTT